MSTWALLDDFRRWRDLAARTGYKPGRRVEITLDPAGLVYWKMYETVPDARHPGHPPIDLVHTRMLGDWPGDDRLAGLLLRRYAHEAECHEADEWFTLDGERLSDPHAPLAGSLLTHDLPRSPA